jgi:Holliday junction resolvasome RuvABC DNA-binding subunit
LGYKQAQINNTIKELDKLGEFSGTIEEVIRKALSKMI